MFEYHARHFDIGEINNTSYRLPHDRSKCRRERPGDLHRHR